MNDWDDRAVDAAMQELHGSKPPDLSARVLLALQESEARPLPRLLPRPAGAAWGRLAALLCAALLLGFGGAWLALRRTLPEPERAVVVELELEVLAGDVGAAPATGGRASHGVAGSTFTFPAGSGSRLWCTRASTFRLGTFGVLTTAADTELEVKDMAISKMQGVVVASSLTLAVVAGVVTWQSLTRGEAAAAGESLTLRAGAVAPDQKLQQENAELRRRLDELERQNQDLRSSNERELAAEPPKPASAVTAEVAETPAPKPSGMTFSDPRFAEALAKIDWNAMGAVTHEMSPVLAELVAAMTKEGAELPMELAIKVQQLNSKLLEQVPALLAAGVPGFGANGSFTHPLVAANTLASTLLAAGQTMTPAQQQRLAGLVHAFSAEAQSIADSTHELSLDQLLAETEMKDRFFAEMGGTLTPEQSQTIYPKGANGFDGGSLFDTGVTMRAHMQPIEARNPAEFARSVSSNLSQSLGLDEATTQQVRDIIARGAAADELWRDPAGPAETSQGHFLRSGRGTAALRHQVQWMRAIQQQVQLTPEQRRKLGKMSRVLVPLPR